MVGETVVLGVYDQLGLKFDETAEKQTVLEYVVDQIQADDGNSMGETPNEARELLRQFEFPISRWQERISVLSGGERRRLQILSVLSVVSNQVCNGKMIWFEFFSSRYSKRTGPHCSKFCCTTHVRCVQFFSTAFHDDQKPNFLVLDERELYLE